MFTINYSTPWRFGAQIIVHDAMMFPGKLRRLSDEVEFGNNNEWLDIQNFKFSCRLEYLPTGARFLLHIGFDAMVHQHSEGFSFMNYWVSMEPLNQAAEDFKNLPEVRGLVPGEESDLSEPFNTWIQLAGGMETQEYRAQPIIEFSERWNVPLRPTDLRQMWHDLVDLSVYPNLELEEDLFPPSRDPSYQGLTHYFKVAAAHRGSTP